LRLLWRGTPARIRESAPRQLPGHRSNLERAVDAHEDVAGLRPPAGLDVAVINRGRSPRGGGGRRGGEQRRPNNDHRRSFPVQARGGTPDAS
jgi:hypothetical protein